MNEQWALGSGHWRSKFTVHHLIIVNSCGDDRLVAVTNGARPVFADQPR